MSSAFERAWEVVKYVDVVIAPSEGNRGSTSIDQTMTASELGDDEKTSKRYKHREDKDFRAAQQGLAPHPAENIDFLQDANARKRPHFDEKPFNELGISTIQYPRQRGMVLPEDGGVRDARPQRDPLGDEESWQKPDYFRGSSLPKPNQFGGMTTVNVAATGKDGMDWENDFEGSAQQFAEIADHEEVHNLINDEMTSWAKEAAGYTDDMENLTGEYDPMQVYNDINPRYLNEDGTVNFMGKITADRKFQESEKGQKRNKIKSNYRQLRSMGHEFGAFTNQGPDQRLSNMAGYSFGDYVTGDKDIKDLHSDESNKRNREIRRRLDGNE
jgi:hypothetical protein